MKRGSVDPVRAIAAVLALGMIAFFTVELILEDDPWDRLSDFSDLSGPTPAKASNHDRTCSSRCN